MPQMGESIAEGTIVRWIKKVGDAVDRDEPLFEISTDKVDAEIPSPAAGVLTEIKVKEGETVAVNSVVATIGEASEVAAGRERRAERRRAAAAPARDAVVRRRRVRRRRRARPPRRSARSRTDAPHRQQTMSTDDSRRQQFVAARAPHRAAKQRGHLADSRLGPRRARDEARHPRVHRDRAPGDRIRSPGRTRTAAPAAPIAEPATPDPAIPASRVEIKPLSVMRKKIAEHMVMSRRTSAHVHSVFHVNFSTVEQIRAAEEGRVRAVGREADVHGVHREGRRSTRCAASRSSTRRSTATTSSTGRTSTSASRSRSRAA